MRTVGRFASAAIGLIGAIDFLILNILVSLYHSVQRLTGADPRSHGWIGLVLIVLALIGVALVLFEPHVGGILLIIAGVGSFFVLHWWALLCGPQLLVGGIIPFLAEGESGQPAKPREQFGPPTQAA